MYLLTLYFCHNTSRHYDYQSVHQSCFWHEYVHSHLQVYSIQIFVAAFLSCKYSFQFQQNHANIRAATKGKTGKTVVLPGFCKIEYHGGRSRANTVAVLAAKIYCGRVVYAFQLENNLRCQKRLIWMNNQMHASL